ncbi:13362_t:CDS:2 [Acaulospora colombiana]|uniref:13362_t:CDS:1 n=1 Tax=Acaulospora colombiana TaxID=27376 RepID=A0ACA9NKR3_9GLOM|nr:13362_t:CDS:2 [Acaulospora colombiana]
MSSSLCNRFGELVQGVLQQSSWLHPPTSSCTFQRKGKSVSDKRCHSGALACPAAVAASAARRLGAALDIVGGARTLVADVFSACSRTFCCGNADTWGTSRTSTFTVYCCTFDEFICDIVGKGASGSKEEDRGVGGVLGDTVELEGPFIDLEGIYAWQRSMAARPNPRIVLDRAYDLVDM